MQPVIGFRTPGAARIVGILGELQLICGKGSSVDRRWIRSNRTQARAARIVFASALVLALAFGLTSSLAHVSAQQPHPDVPDAPAPQAPKPMSDMKDQVTPGSGSQLTQPVTSASPTSSSGSGSADGQTAQPQTPNSPGQAPANAPDNFQTSPPQTPEAGKGVEETVTVIHSSTTAVEVP